MNIDSYVADLERRIVQSPLISSYTITIDRKTADIAFISGIMDLRNGVTVDFKEYIEDNGDTIQKFMYGYNVRQDADILFRYDNSPDPKRGNLLRFLIINTRRAVKLSLRQKLTFSLSLKK